MKIGLALSGGGVLGAAHLGLLSELEKNNVKLDIVSGTSIGAILGLLYIDGGMKSVESFLDDLKGAGIFSKGNIKFALPDKVFEQIKISLQKIVRAKNFYDLPIKFCCVATDLESGEAVVLENGNVVDAVMASSAYPGVFLPQEIHGKLLVDGGITINLPTKILKDKKADFIIGSSLFGISKFEDLGDRQKYKVNRIKIALRSLDIIQKELAQRDMKKCDFCFDMPVNDYQWYHFDKIDEIRKAGEEHATEEIKKLIKLLGDHKTKPKRTFWERVLKV